MDDLLREFLTETSESLDTVDNQLVKFEQEPNNAKILDNIFRLVHTIKGTCGFLGLPRLEALAHAGETLMGKFRDGMPVRAEAVTVILSSLDRIKEILAGLEATEAEPEGNDRDLIDQLPPSTGPHSRLLILRALLTGWNPAVSNSPAENGMRLHQELAELIRLLRSTSRNPPGGRVDVYAQSLLPYYQSDLAEHSQTLERQGVFRAFKTISVTSPMLVVVVCDHDSDTRGLCEGAILANASGHRVIIAVIGSARDLVPPEVLGLQEMGIMVLQIGSANLANAIRQAIIDIPAMRIRNPRQLQHSLSS